MPDDDPPATPAPARIPRRRTAPVASPRGRHGASTAAPAAAKVPAKVPAKALSGSKVTAADQPPARPAPAAPVPAIVQALRTPTGPAIERPVPPWSEPLAAPTRGTVVPPARRRRKALRAAVLLIVLLLTAAAGLGAAAVVKTRPHTWQAATVVTLQPASLGTDAAAVSAAVERYRTRVGTQDFTTLAALRTNLPAGTVREQLAGLAVGPDSIRLVARAATHDHAVRLADSAGQTLASTITSDQNGVTGDSNRVSATYGGAARSATLLAPTDRDAYLAGGLAAGAVLVLSLAFAVLHGGRKSPS